MVAYNFILPAWLLELPTHNVLNVHPSLLPLLRGPSPIRTAILENQPEAVGVSIMLMDAQMDHGPLLAQEAYEPDHWPVPGPTLDATLAAKGGALLAATIPHWLAGDIVPQTQSHAHATYSKRFSKADAELNLDPHQLPTGEAAQRALRVIYAFAGIGDAYFVHNDVRVKIKQATLTADGSLNLLRVTPAGKAGMDFDSFLFSLT